MSPVWCIEVATVGREVYLANAPTADEARAMFERGELTKPALSEVTEAEFQFAELYPSDAA